MFRDDKDAMLARLEALELQVGRYDRELAARDHLLAERDARIAFLETELERLGRDLIDREASLLDFQRRRGVAGKPVAATSAEAMASPEARWSEAERLLAEGVERYRGGDKEGATTCFERGLSLVPNHSQLQRALRRYT